MTNDLKVLKKRLLEEDKIHVLFEELNCEYIKYEQGGNLITAQLPPDFHSDNKRAVQCRLNEYLSCSIRNRADFKGDIFSLISYIKNNKRGEEINKDLFEAKKFICRTLGWNDLLNPDDEQRIDYLAKLKSIKRKTKRKIEVEPNPILDESVFNNFVMKPIKAWKLEGINYGTQLTYQVGFDVQTGRITIPIRNRFGNLVGVKGRLINDSDINDYNPKYKYIYRCNMSKEWFNLDRALSHIKSKKEVIIFESEKSVMKMHSNGIYNCLAISSSDVTDIQADTILKIGYDIDILLAYDSDKTSEEIRYQAEKFENRDVYAIVDINKLLGEKEAPIDKGIKVWNELYETSKFQVVWKDDEDIGMD